MVVKKELIRDKLKELDAVLEGLRLHKENKKEDLALSVTLRWAVERGVLLGATIIFDVSDHILSGYFAAYPTSYEDSLRMLRDKKVVSEQIYSKLKGLGGFRNLLVHDYAEVDLGKLVEGVRQALEDFPAFSAEIQEWTDRQG